MDEIKPEIRSAIEKESTIRIAVDVPTSSILPTDNILRTASDRVRPLIEEFGRDNLMRLLAVDVYPRHIYIAIDINNREYDYNTAHQQMFSIPVYILRFSKREGKWTFFRRATEDKKLARTIADLHRCNGTNPTPFLADHIKGSVYPSPRTA